MIVRFIRDLRTFSFDGTKKLIGARRRRRINALNQWWALVRDPWDEGFDDLGMNPLATKFKRALMRKRIEGK